MTTLFQLIPPDEYHMMLQETDEAIQKGYDHAKAEWRLKVLEILYETCKDRDQFTVNDFRGRVKDSGVETHDNRAMGGIMKTAQRYGWIMPTGEEIPSRVGHKTPLQIWKSLRY